MEEAAARYARRVRRGAAVIAVGFAVCACADTRAPPPLMATAQEPLARFLLREPIDHRWRDEIVHFDVDLPASERAVHVVDAWGTVAPTELERLEGRARVSTVVTLEPGATLTLEVRAGVAPAVGAVVIRRVPGGIVLANDRVELQVPVWPGASRATDLRQVPPPVGAVRVGSSRVDLQACKLEYSIVSPK